MSATSSSTIRARLSFAALASLVSCSTVDPKAPLAAFPAEHATHWSASLKAEAVKDYARAQENMNYYKLAGGDAYLGSLRTGWLHYLLGDFAKAEKAYTAAAELQPSSMTALVGRMNAALALKDLGKTEHAAAAVLRAEPSNYKAQMVLAGLYFAQKDYLRSALVYRSLLKHYPDDMEVRSGVAWTTFYLGDKTAAAKQFHLILSHNPSYPLAQKGLELCLGKKDASRSTANQTQG